MLTVAVILAVMTTAIMVIASSLVMESALSQEKRHVQNDLERVKAVLCSFQSTQGRTVLDWAGWDYAYEFIQDLNQQYIDSNLADTDCSWPGKSWELRG